MGTALATASDHRRIEVREALLALRDANTQSLNPRTVVEAARDEESPLHNYFEWDDGAAAEAFRLVQAEGLIRRAKITVVREARAERGVSLSVTREYQSRPSMRSIGYESVETIMSDEGRRDEMLEQARKELSAFRRRYESLAELAEVFGAIEQVIGRT